MNNLANIVWVGGGGDCSFGPIFWSTIFFPQNEKWNKTWNESDCDKKWSIWKKMIKKIRADNVAEERNLSRDQILFSPYASTVSLHIKWSMMLIPGSTAEKTREILTTSFLYACLAFNGFSIYCLAYGLLADFISSSDLEIDIKHYQVLARSTFFFTAFVSSSLTDKLVSRYCTVISSFVTIFICDITLFIITNFSYYGNNLETELVLEPSDSTILPYFTLLVVFVKSAVSGIVFGESIILGATHIRHPRAIVLCFHGYLLFHFLGMVLAHYVIVDWNTTTKLYINSGCHFLSFLGFIIASQFHEEENRIHIEDPFFSALSILYMSLPGPEDFCCESFSVYVKSSRLLFNFINKPRTAELVPPAA